MDAVVRNRSTIMWAEKNDCFTNLCRLCGCTSNETHYLFGSNQNDMNLSNANDTIQDKLNRLLPLSISVNDPKPKRICQSCLNKLNEYDDFISMCLATDINFNNILESLSCKLDSENNQEKCILVLEDKSVKNVIYSPPSNNILVVNKPNDISLHNNENDLYVTLELNYKDLQQGVVNIFKCNEDTYLVNTNNVLSSDVQNVMSNLVNEKEDSSKAVEVSETPVKNVNPETEILKGRKDKVRKFQCNICNKMLARKSNLTTHLALHSEVRPHKCEECGKRFVIAWDLSIHRHIHSGTYTCDYCRKPFITKSKLERHRRSHTGEKQHACSICKKKFSEKNNMIAHMSVHTGERPYSCSICKKSFRIQSHLSDHKKVHSSNTPFPCLVCGKSFKWKSNLKDHSKYHTGEKFKCIICKKEFKVRADYYKHRKECKEELESRTCCFCLETFSDKSILNDHIKTVHKDEAIYQCELCEKVFRTLTLLKSHIGSNVCLNKTQVFRCDLCPMVFLKKHNFISHFKTHQKVLTVYDNDL